MVDILIMDIRISQGGWRYKNNNKRITYNYSNK
jgi:hypothetical protein